MYCGMGCLIFNYDMEPNPEHILKNVTFNDNIYMFCGFNTMSTRDWYPDRRGQNNGGFNGRTLDQRFENSMAHTMAWDLTNENLRVTNNKYILSASQLIKFDGYSKKNYSVHDGNVYAQLPGTIWLTVLEKISIMGSQLYTDPDDVFGKYIHDKNATIIRFDK